MTAIIKNGKVDVRFVYNGETKELKFEFDLPQEDYGFDDIIFNTPVHVNGKVTRRAEGSDKSEGYTELALTVSADISTVCARCLEPVNEKLEYIKVYGLTEMEVSEDSEDYISTVDGSVNVAESARALFLLNFPMRFLCSDSCLGLCGQCGKNLNEGDCDCGKKEIDPRLAVLKNLKFE